ncbi:MAG TPA: PilZ domain-containing protein [Rhodanobacteraceae bacterium]|nr:PilZ domain-containing protein [Rhodanobacteraceae bacterium]
MSDSEQRRATRKAALGSIEVSDALTGENIGRIGNLSRNGMMLIGRRTLTADALYQVRFHLPDREGRMRLLEAGVHEQWSEPAAVPGQHWAGLRIIALSETDGAVLSEWLDEPEQQ